MDMGPILDASQVKSIDHYVQQAKEEGAEVDDEGSETKKFYLRDFLEISRCP